MLTLKLQYFGNLMWRDDSLENTLMLGMIEGKRSEWQRMRWLDTIINSMNINLIKLWEIVKDRGAWHAAVHGISKSLIQISDWKTTKSLKNIDVTEGLKKPLSIMFQYFLSAMFLGERLWVYMMPSSSGTVL